MATQPRDLMTVDASSDSIDAYAIAQTAPHGGMVMPLASAREAQAAIAAYEHLKSAIVRPDDIQKIQGRDFLKKSFWRRVAACFGLSLELVTEERIMRENGVLAYSAIYRAIAPNGRTMTGDGYCDTTEKRGMPEHNIRAIAHTRAKNRAISDLVGGGEVSAEEMPEDDETRLRLPSGPASTTNTPDLIAVALKKTPILQLLNKLGLRSRDSQRDKLVEVKATLEGVHKDFNGENVIAELQRQVNVSEAASAQTDLSGLEMGAPGN